MNAPILKNTAVEIGNRLHIKPGFESALDACGLRSLQDLFNVPNAGTLSKPGLNAWRERIPLQLRINGVDTTCYLKRFSRPPRSAQREVRRSGTEAKSVAGLEWTWAARLAANGIACMEPIAFGEELDGNREIRSAILTPAVPGQSLEQWARNENRPGRDRVRALIPRVAALVARLHGAGYIHRDLYLSHIFHDDDAVEASLHLIDLQRVIRPRWFMRRWIVKDLAALNASTPHSLVSRSDRVRWLKHYLGVRKLNRMGKCLTLSVIGKTQAIARHEQRRLARLRITP